jgi:hypothetical protein
MSLLSITARRLILAALLGAAAGCSTSTQPGGVVLSPEDQAQALKLKNEILVCNEGSVKSLVGPLDLNHLGYFRVIFIPEKGVSLDAQATQANNFWSSALEYLWPDQISATSFFTIARATAESTPHAEGSRLAELIAKVATPISGQDSAPSYAVIVITQGDGADMLEDALTTLKSQDPRRPSVTLACLLQADLPSSAFLISNIPGPAKGSAPVTVKR